MKKQTLKELKEVIEKLGTRVITLTPTKVSRGNKVKNETGIVVLKLTEAERQGLGLLEVRDCGFNGETVYVIA